MIIIINCVLGFINLLILIGLAGTVTKILQYLAVAGDKKAGMEVKQLLNLPTGQFYRNEQGQLVETGQATYADPSVLAGGEPHYDGITDRPSTSNWDGVPVQE